MKVNKSRNKRTLFISVSIMIVTAILVISILLFLPRPHRDFPRYNHPHLVGAITAERDNVTGGHNWTIRFVAFSDAVKIEYLNCYLKDEEGNVLIKGEPITTLSNNSLTFIYHKDDGYLSGNDTFYIIGQPYGIAKANYTFSVLVKNGNPYRQAFEDIVLE